MTPKDLWGGSISPDENQSSEILQGLCSKYICGARKGPKMINESKNLGCGLFPSQVSALDLSFITDKFGTKQKRKEESAQLRVQKKQKILIQAGIEQKGIPIL